MKLKKLLEKEDTIQIRFCKLLSLCSINEKFEIDVCKESFDLEIKSDYDSTLRTICSYSMRIHESDQDVIGVEDVNNLKNIEKMNDKEFIETYIVRETDKKY